MPFVIYRNFLRWIYFQVIIFGMIVLEFHDLTKAVSCVMVGYKKGVDTIYVCFLKLFRESSATIKRNPVRAIVEIWEQIMRM